MAELVAALAVATDLGLGLPMEHVLRQSLIAMRLADRLGLSEQERVDLYYVSLLAWVGCWVDAHDQAKWWSDDHAIKAAAYDNGRNPVGLQMMRFGFGHLGQGLPAVDRLRLRLAFVAGGRKEVDGIASKHCAAAHQLAVRIGVTGTVAEELLQTWERWDGRGAPAGRKGDEIARSVRIVALADVAAFHELEQGTDAAIAMVREYSGTLLDPALVEVYCACARELLADVTPEATLQAVLAAEPALSRTMDDAEVLAALEAVADFADVKSPFTIGHSRALADLATEAATVMGLPVRDVALVRRAGLVADLGRLGVSNAIWDKPAALSRAEWERVRLHPYFTDRMLAQSPALSAAGALAGFHHERMDGSGYPRALRGDTIPAAGRLLGAADSYCAMLEPRPHRAALTPQDAAAELRREVRTGRLGAEAVDATLAAAGHQVRRRRENVVGLTAREIQVLRLLARGLSNRQIAAELVISPRTVGSHVEHIYAKTSTCNRALASLFAAERGLL
jgi:HD-GYP domain-containing protein (c-di-GMP phosphodiesterase class II)